MTVKNKPVKGYAGGLRLFTQTPRRGLLGNSGTKGHENKRGSALLHADPLLFVGFFLEEAYALDREECVF
jgi:hypothetical protein